MSLASEALSILSQFGIEPSEGDLVARSPITGAG
jgi:hypothetical protein